MAGISNCSPCNRNPAFLNFGQDAPTAGEIRSAKASAVGGGKKKCQKGKSCSATCIAANEDCLVEFPEPVQMEIRKMAAYIMSQREKAGAPIAPGSEEDIQIGEGVKLVGGQLRKEGTYQRGSGKYKKEVKERTFDTTTRGQSRIISPSEIRDLKANRDKLGDAEFNKKAMELLQKEVNSRGVTLDRKNLELVFDSLPMAARTALMQSGNPGKGKWYGVDENGKEATNLNNGTRERGIKVLEMYLRQGGMDAYGNSKRVMSPADFDVEHVRPASKGGLDHPSNWILARSGAQRQRADAELGKWIDKLPNPDDKAAMNKYYSTEARKMKTKNAAKALAASIDPRSLPDAELIKVSPKNLRYMFDRDSFFASGFYGLGSGGARLTGAPPVPVSKAYALVRKYNDDASKGVRSDVKRIWNKEWMEGGGSTQKMTSDMINLFKGSLEPAAFKAVLPQLQDWQNQMLSSFPSTSPGVGSASAAPKAASKAPAKKPASKSKAMSQKQAEAALDDLLADL